MQKVPIEKLAGSFISYPDEAEYTIEKIPARSLFDYRRFDFGAKLLYIDHYIKGLDMTYAREVYSAQVKAITAGSNSEKGNDDKNSLEDFIKTFEYLILDIKETITTNNANTKNTIAIATSENNKPSGKVIFSFFNIIIFYTYPIYKLTSTTSSVSFLSL